MKKDNIQQKNLGGMPNADNLLYEIFDRLSNMTDKDEVLWIDFEKYGSVYKGSDMFSQYIENVKTSNDTIVNYTDSYFMKHKDMAMIFLALPESYGLQIQSEWSEDANDFAFFPKSRTHESHEHIKNLASAIKSQLERKSKYYIELSAQRFLKKLS